MWGRRRAASKFLGTYRLVIGKVVNKKPAWRHTEDGSRWIAYTTKGTWNGQYESSLGKPEGYLSRADAGCLTPDQSSMPWSAHSGKAGDTWRQYPQLRCSVYSPPPLGLHLEGSLPGEASITLISSASAHQERAINTVSNTYRHRIPHGVGLGIA